MCNRKYLGGEMPDELSDAEVLCGFMEARPMDIPVVGGSVWWPLVGNISPTRKPVLEVCHKIEKLGLLHLIEKRLTAEQWVDYFDGLSGQPPREKPPCGYAYELSKRLIHATADQKIKALAAVLREGKRD
jgi:hypothetical protein